MRRVLANAVVLAGLLALLCPYVQARGAPRSFGGSRGFYRPYPASPRPHLVPRQSRSVTPSSNTSRGGIAFPPVTGSSLINFGQSACLLNPSYAGSFYCRQYYTQTPSLGFEPIYPFWLPSTGNETEQPAPPAPETEQDTQLAAQVGNLATEVELMREDQALRDSRGAPPTAPSVAGEEKPPATLLVYRDGHQVEVQDYAILGKTLWVFSNQATRRVPLADLDLAATQRLNGERGVDFVTPDPQ